MNAIIVPTELVKFISISMKLMKNKKRGRSLSNMLFKARLYHLLHPMGRAGFPENIP